MEAWMDENFIKQIFQTVLGENVTCVESHAKAKVDSDDPQACSEASKTLWTGEMEAWMDENFIKQVFRPCLVEALAAMKADHPFEPVYGPEQQCDDLSETWKTPSIRIHGLEFQQTPPHSPPPPRPHDLFSASPTLKRYQQHHRQKAWTQTTPAWEDVKTKKKLTLSDILAASEKNEVENQKRLDIEKWEESIDPISLIQRVLEAGMVGPNWRRHNSPKQASIEYN
ncbi:hypothetical protein CONLIGDRAFT_680815 [Coniochaeta ligniaria NRRL 30616]|uniref:Uncharacterized protein n=1 Tax=Coniochaeta ligniaria NRRL 30616 TaxID=1408157 RepID=A0A1J7JJL7_9PEZI|nr:hypothetical protein CONLIGDRAFT_680815 [Coniochaeta ligniaria NRRL 30616]